MILSAINMITNKFNWFKSLVWTFNVFFCKLKICRCRQKSEMTRHIKYVIWQTWNLCNELDFLNSSWLKNWKFNCFRKYNVLETLPFPILSPQLSFDFQRFCNADIFSIHNSHFTTSEDQDCLTTNNYLNKNDGKKLHGRIFPKCFCKLKMVMLLMVITSYDENVSNFLANKHQTISNLKIKN